MPLSPLTVVVGPSGAGKTTVLRATDLVLGDTWPRMWRWSESFRKDSMAQGGERAFRLSPTSVSSACSSPRSRPRTTV
ncbi:MAG: hypothetical protein QME79_06050 [Bacillota bacterium]|nr:hypothetical protein [Bacillota bacterium]